MGENHYIVQIDQTDVLRSGNSDTRNDSYSADQLACDCNAVEPALKLPVIARSRSKQCHHGPGHCSVGHFTDIYAFCRYGDEMYVDDNLTVRDANAISPARPSVCKGGIGYLSLIHI